MKADPTAGLIEGSAERLFAAARDGQLVELLSASVPTLDVSQGYAIQDALLARHVAAGAVVTGAKLGLTSIAKQVEMQVHEPIGGWLTDRMALAAEEPLLVSSLVQPRCEPEIAFLLRSDIAGPDVTVTDVMAATESLMVAIEVLDSRYRDYRFTLPDVIADDASAARFLVGMPVTAPMVDRTRCQVTFDINGTPMGSATGAAVMGDPAAAVAWWVRHLATSGRGLRAGMVVLSGALMGAHTVAAGDLVRASIEGLGTLELVCR